MSNSSPTINKLFFFNKQDSQNILGLLAKHMHTKISSCSSPIQDHSNIAYDIVTCPDIDNRELLQHEEPILKTEEIQEVQSNEESTEDLSTEYISPTHQDTIFWCIYIIIHGYNDYIQVSRNYGVKLNSVKKQISDWINLNPSAMKQTNIKITKAAVQEIRSELLTSIRDTSYLSLMGMLVFHKINLILISANGKTMVEFISNKDVEQPTYVLHKDAFGKYMLQVDSMTKEQIEELKTRVYCLESYLKPLKTISHYQVADLYAIAKQIGIFNETKKYKKTELYDELHDVLQWK